MENLPHHYESSINHEFTIIQPPFWCIFVGFKRISFWPSQKHRQRGQFRISVASLRSSGCRIAWSSWKWVWKRSSLQRSGMGWEYFWGRHKMAWSSDKIMTQKSLLILRSGMLGKSDCHRWFLVSGNLQKSEFLIKPVAPSWRIRRPVSRHGDRPLATTLCHGDGQTTDHHHGPQKFVDPTHLQSDTHNCNKKPRWMAKSTKKKSTNSIAMFDQRRFIPMEMKVLVSDLFWFAARKWPRGQAQWSKRLEMMWGQLLPWGRDIGYCWEWRMCLTESKAMDVLQILDARRVPGICTWRFGMVSHDTNCRGWFL